jgi:hypothetical protein
MTTSLKSFSAFIAEAAPGKAIAFTFGRLNPPTIGHEKLLDATAKVAQHNGCTYRVYVSHTQDSKKNPLSHAQKVKFAREMFPKHARAIVNDGDADTILNVASLLYAQGFTQIMLVVGDDRVTEFETLLNKYNNEKMAHGFYNFRSIKVLSAGERDPDSDGVTGMSASKMRAAAVNNDLNAFAKGLPHAYGGVETLFNAVRVGMGLKESTNFRRHIQLESTGERREAYINGDLFNDGDSVVIKETQEVGIVRHLGSNYIVVELAEGKRVRKWLDAVEPLEEKAMQDSLPFERTHYAPIKREPLGLMARPLSALRNRK